MNSSLTCLFGPSDASFSYSFHCLSFPFLKEYRLEKGHIVPALCSHSYKKKAFSTSIPFPAFSMDDIITCI